MLTFDESAHAYFWHGRKVPGVTSVLSDLLDWSRIPADRRVAVLEEGRAIHTMAEWHFAGELDTETLPDWMRPRYEALMRFIDDTGFECERSEYRVFHGLFAYAGTLDLRGTLRHNGTRRQAFLDIKRSLYGGRVTGLQLAAYEGAYEFMHGKDDTLRAALHLGADGKYRMEWFEDRNDFNVFVSCLTRHLFKERLQ